MSKLADVHYLKHLKIAFSPQLELLTLHLVFTALLNIVIIVIAWYSHGSK